MKGGIDMDFASFDSQEMPGGGWVVKPYTVYVSPYFVYNGDGYVQDISPDRFTKHYYAGNERIASRLNREGQSATQHNPTNIYTTYDPDFPVLSDLQEVLPLFSLQPELDTEPAGYPPNPIEYEDDCQELFGNDQLEYERCMCLHFPATAAEQSIDCPSYEPIYWYHPDYLGHTDFVTDRTGQPYQHFFYAPFGEALLSQHTGTGYYNTPYRFNAKELDSETGLIYYGARYYMPKESVWLSVDPLAHKYPGLSGYNFVASNPIMLVDPDGRWIKGAGFINNLLYTDKRNEAFIAGGKLKDNISKNESGWLVTYVDWQDGSNSSSNNLNYTTNTMVAIQFQDNGERSIDDGIANLVRGFCNPFVIVSSSIIMAFYANYNNSLNERRTEYIGESPYCIEEDIGFKQIEGTSSDIAKEVLKATIGAVFFGLSSGKNAAGIVEGVVLDEIEGAAKTAIDKIEEE